MKPGTVLKCTDTSAQGGIPRNRPFLEYDKEYVVEKSTNKTVVLEEDPLKTFWSKHRFSVVKEPLPPINPYFHFLRMIRLKN